VTQWEELVRKAGLEPASLSALAPKAFCPGIVGYRGHINHSLKMPLVSPISAGPLRFPLWAAKFQSDFPLFHTAFRVFQIRIIDN
jgi:hypothetical protein